LRSPVARPAPIGLFVNIRPGQVFGLILLSSVSNGLLPVPLRAQQEAPKPEQSKSKEESAGAKPKVAAQPPLPPVRPPGLTPAPGQQQNSVPKSVQPTQPQSEPTIPDFNNPPLRTTVPANPTGAPATPPSALPAPPMLPSASRLRMHQCGQEWDKMKATGSAADQTWRAFAQICLAKP